MRPFARDIVRPSATRLIGIDEDLGRFAPEDQQALARRPEPGRARTCCKVRKRSRWRPRGQAARAVNAGFYALVVTSLAAIVLSGLIVWLYVERNLVRRLVGLTGAMQRLTEGDLAVSVAEDGTDELQGAMAKAVGVFRDESERRRALEAGARAHQRGTAPPSRGTAGARWSTERTRTNAAGRGGQPRRGPRSAPRAPAGRNPNSSPP